MSLIPSETVYSSENGDAGVVVYAIQKALNATALKPENKIVVDSAYGDSTEEAVRRFQVKKGIDDDGKFGPETSATMAAALEPKVRSSVIPPGLLRGLIEGESGNLIGAVNWSVAGGVDCSYCQRRVYDEHYNDLEVVRRAFDPLYQMSLFANRLRDRHDAYYGWTHVKTHEWAWRLATLYHNWPYAASKIASVGYGGLSSYWFTPAAWVVNIGASMDNGTPVQTPLGWAKFYSLGAPEYDHKGKMVKYVQQWIP
jgi:hypothetical protein